MKDLALLNNVIKTEWVTMIMLTELPNYLEGKKLSPFDMKGSKPLHLYLL